jgi:hypothetical protein
MTMSRRSVPSFLCALWLAGLLSPTLPALGKSALPTDDKTAVASTPNADPHAVLVELFTSEGCSSCPPADGLIQKLDAHQPIPGAQLIVLSEHVTYWDHDGWKDPNSSQALTDRQNAYEGALRQNTAFTPQIIVDGTEEIRNGYTPQQVEEVLEKAKAAPKIPVRIGQATVDSANPALLRVHIETGESSDKHNADVYVAIALDHVESQVLHGENGGRHLVHVAVVQELTKIGKLQKGRNFAQDVELKLKPGTDPKNLRLMAFVQESGNAKVLGAALRKPAIQSSAAMQ